MKKLLSLLLVLVFSLSIISPVLAESSRSGSIRKEKVSSREAKLKEKLSQFKDQKKAQRVDKINTELNRINNKRTDQMLKFLDNAERILAKVPSSSNNAQAKIDEARTAVKAQAEKDYTITITSETKVKDDAKLTHESLRTDLQALKKLITEAKQAVANAIKEARGK